MSAHQDLVGWGVGTDLFLCSSYGSRFRVRIRVEEDGGVDPDEGVVGEGEEFSVEADEEEEEGVVEVRIWGDGGEGYEIGKEGE